MGYREIYILLFTYKSRVQRKYYEREKLRCQTQIKE